ncbi:MAG: molybdenum cofactor guanylyltransferase [Thermoproteota archaeon]|jgi:Molybdopterin-guanine dinucleotide biosynthesis protein A
MLGAVILAGGKSKRFGSNKAFAKLKGKEIILWCIEGLNGLVQEIILSVKKIDDRFLNIGKYNVKIVEDLYVLEGPLVGLYSSLLFMKSKYVYIHPVDSPYIIREYVNFMFNCVKECNGCAVVFENGTFDPTHSVVERNAALDYSKKLIENGNTSLKSLFLELPNVKFIKLEELNIKSIDKVFININTKEDLEREDSK